MRSLRPHGKKEQKKKKKKKEKAESHATGAEREVKRGSGERRRGEKKKGEKGEMEREGNSRDGKGNHPILGVVGRGGTLGASMNQVPALKR